MLNRRNRTLTTVLMVSDAVATGLAFLAAYQLRFFSGLISIPEQIPSIAQYLKIMPLVMIIFPGIFVINGLYKIRRGRSIVDEFFSVFLACSLATLITFLALLYYRVYYTPDVAPDWEFSRLVMAIFLGITIVFVSFIRFVIRRTMEHMRRKGINTRNILIAGAGVLGRALVDRIVAHEEFGLKAVGFLDDDEKKKGSIYQGVRVIGTLSDLKLIMLEQKVDILFVCLPPSAHHKVIQLFELANKHLIDIRVVPDLLQYISLNASVELFDGLPVINFDTTPMNGFNRVLKRALDIAFSLFGLLITGVFFPILAGMVKISSRGPIFFRQERMGLDGKPFTLYKFRTMKVDAEDTGPVWAATDDPRATKIGRFMRRTSLDELPQFWNVLKGEMSLVGPRPERPEFVQMFKERVPKYMLRHKMKAGLSGWAQVNGWRGDTSIEKRIEYDLFYIQNWSLALDLKIIWLTISKSMFGKSHY